MLFPLCLTLGLSLGLLWLSLLLTRLLHMREVCAVGVGLPVLVGMPGDPLLPRRVYAAFIQNRLFHFSPGGRVLVLDCGLSSREKADCLGALGGRNAVVFLPPDELAKYLVATSDET